MFIYNIHGHRVVNMRFFIVNCRPKNVWPKNFVTKTRAPLIGLYGLFRDPILETGTGKGNYETLLKVENLGIFLKEIRSVISRDKENSHKHRHSNYIKFHALHVKLKILSYQLVDNRHCTRRAHITDEIKKNVVLRPIVSRYSRDVLSSYIYRQQWNWIFRSRIL